MSHYSVIRMVDKSGRISVPFAFREMLGIERNDPVEVYIIDHTLVIRKAEIKAASQEPKEETAEC